jgi:hypothetical protein
MAYSIIRKPIPPSLCYTCHTHRYMGASKHETRIPANARLEPCQTPVPANCVAENVSYRDKNIRKRLHKQSYTPRVVAESETEDELLVKRVVTSSSRRSLDSTCRNIKYARVSERAKVSAKWIPIASVVPPVAAFVFQNSLDRVVVYSQVTIVLLPSWQYLKSHSMSWTSYGRSFSLGV